MEALRFLRHPDDLDALIRGTGFEDTDLQLQDVSVTITKASGDNEKLFGSVTTKDIATALAEEGVALDRRRIVIEEPIKSLGVYTVTAKLRGGVNADLKVWVVKE